MKTLLFLFLILILLWAPHLWAKSLFLKFIQKEDDLKKYIPYDHHVLPLSLLKLKESSGTIYQTQNIFAHNEQALAFLDEEALTSSEKEKRLKCKRFLALTLDSPFHKQLGPKITKENKAIFLWASEAGPSSAYTLDIETEKFIEDLFQEVSNLFSHDLNPTDLFHAHIVRGNLKDEGDDDIYFLFHGKEFPRDISPYYSKKAETLFAIEPFDSNVSSFKERNILYSLKKQRLYKVSPEDGGELLEGIGETLFEDKIGGDVIGSFNFFPFHSNLYHRPYINLKSRESYVLEDILMKFSYADMLSVDDKYCYRSIFPRSAMNP